MQYIKPLKQRLVESFLLLKAYLKHLWQYIAFSRVFDIGRLVIGVNLAKTGYWSTTSATERRIHLVSLHTATQNENTVFCVIVGPLSLVFGFLPKNSA